MARPSLSSLDVVLRHAQALRSGVDPEDTLPAFLAAVRARAFPRAALLAKREMLAALEARCSASRQQRAFIDELLADSPPAS